MISLLILRFLLIVVEQNPCPFQKFQPKFIPCKMSFWGRWQPLCHTEGNNFFPSYFIHYCIGEFTLWNSYFTKTRSQRVKPDDNEGKMGNRILCETELILDMCGVRVLGA